MAARKQGAGWPLIAGVALGALVTYLVDSKRNRAMIGPAASQSSEPAIGGRTSDGTDA